MLIFPRVKEHQVHRFKMLMALAVATTSFLAAASVASAETVRVRASRVSLGRSRTGGLLVETGSSQAYNCSHISDIAFNRTHVTATSFPIILTTREDLRVFIVR